MAAPNEEGQRRTTLAVATLMLTSLDDDSSSSEDSSSTSSDVEDMVLEENEEGDGRGGRFGFLLRFLLCMLVGEMEEYDEIAVVALMAQYLLLHSRPTVRYLPAGATSGLRRELWTFWNLAAGDPEMVVSVETPFYAYIRMTAGQFNKLGEHVFGAEWSVPMTTDFKIKRRRRGRRPYHPWLRLLVLLFRISAPGIALHHVQALFGVSRAMISRTTAELSMRIVENCHDFVQWPSLNEARATVEELQGWYDDVGLAPNHLGRLAFGIVDGTHLVYSRAPLAENDPVAHRSYKGSYSSVVQAVVNPVTGKFIYVSPIVNGRMHDARAWRLSHPSLDPAAYHLHDRRSFALLTSGIGVPDRYTLLADNAYPSRDEPWLVKRDLAGSFTDPVSRIRAYVEIAFGMLKSKWRILSALNVHDFTTIPFVIYTTFILHNFLIDTTGDESISQLTVSMQ